MTAANHAVTGSLIAVMIDKPVLALPLAFFSHFVQDALPHFGYPGPGGFDRALKHRFFRVMFYTDPVFLAVLAGILILLSVDFWVYATALVALSPDFEWLMAYYGYERRGKKPPRSPFAQLHTRIQQLERPWGAAVELGWYLAGIILLVSIIK